MPNIANMIDRAGQGHSLCEFLLGKSRSYYLSRKHDDFAELCDDENKLGSDSIAVVGSLVAGAAIAIWDRGLSYTLIATQLLIVLWAYTASQARLSRNTMEVFLCSRLSGRNHLCSCSFRRPGDGLKVRKEPSRNDVSSRILLFTTASNAELCSSCACALRCELSMCLQTKVRILLFPVALLCCAINAKTCLAQLPACASEMPDDRSTH